MSAGRPETDPRKRSSRLKTVAPKNYKEPTEQDDDIEEQPNTPESKESRKRKRGGTATFNFQEAQVNNNKLGLRKLDSYTALENRKFFSRLSIMINNIL